jgi:DNA-binding IscR family transcriptional regulator
MIWIYLSWLIVLLGLIVAYAWQNTEIIRREISERRVSFLCREKAALAILMLVTRKFYEDGQPWNTQRLSGHLDLPPRLRMKVLDELVDLGFLAEVVDEKADDVYQPAKSPDQVTVADVIARFRRRGENLDCPPEVHEWGRISELEERLRQVESETLEGMTLKDLAFSSGGSGTAGEAVPG